MLPSSSPPSVGVLGMLLQLADDRNARTPVAVTDPPPDPEPEPEASSFVRTARGSGAAPAFPVRCLPEPARRLVEEASAAVAVPPEMVAVPLLVAAGAASGNRRRLRLKEGFDQFPILWGGVVAAPGTGKTPAAEAGLDAARRLQREAFDRHRAELAAYEESAGPDAASAGRPRLEHVFTADATTEAVAPMLVGSPGLLVARDELVAWVKSFNAYRAGADRQFWLESWSGAPIKVDRKTTDGIYVPEPVVGVTGGIQWARLPDLQDEAAQLDGFVDRMLWAVPEVAPALWSEAVVAQATKDRVLAVMRELRGTGSPPAKRVVCLSEAAKSAYVGWFNANQALVGDSVGMMRGIHAKMPLQATRLALVLHLLADPAAARDTLSLGTMQGALALVDYFRAQASRVAAVLDPGRPDPLAALERRLVGFLADGDWASRTELHRRLGNHVTAATLKLALARLKATGAAERQQVEETGGRHREEWRLVDLANEEGDLPEEDKNRAEA